MSELGDHPSSPARKRYLMTRLSVLLALASTGLIALLLPEMSVGTSIWLRIVFGLMYSSSATLLIYGINRLFRYIPIKFLASFIGSGIVLTWLIYNIFSEFIILPYSTNWYLTVAAVFLFSFSTLALITLLAIGLFERPKITGAAVCIFILLITALWSLKNIPKSFTHEDIPSLLRATSRLGLPNPAQGGKFKVRTLTYGSGKDKHRPEYGQSANIITQPVDASSFVPEGWSVARTAYWGFDQSHVPINGRVWMPDGKGPFPLVLIVHGTRLMTSFSDAGFAYLGELLASRGYIVVSIDENFLNYGWHRYGDFKQSDIDARAWIILQHICVWRGWNRDTKSSLYDKVDMNRIALIGHSRGGEAISAAIAFNRMERYPKNGNIPLAFHFNIRTLIAFAPSDIYQPRYERHQQKSRMLITSSC